MKSWATNNSTGKKKRINRSSTYIPVKEFILSKLDQQNIIKDNIMVDQNITYNQNQRQYQVGYQKRDVQGNIFEIIDPISEEKLDELLQYEIVTDVNQEDRQLYQEILNTCKDLGMSNFQQFRENQDIILRALTAPQQTYQDYQWYNIQYKLSKQYYFYNSVNQEISKRHPDFQQIIFQINKAKQQNDFQELPTVDKYFFYYRYLDFKRNNGKIKDIVSNSQQDEKWMFLQCEQALQQLNCDQNFRTFQNNFDKIEQCKDQIFAATQPPHNVKIVIVKGNNKDIFFFDQQTSQQTLSHPNIKQLQEECVNIMDTHHIEIPIISSSVFEKYINNQWIDRCQQDALDFLKHILNYKTEKDLKKYKKHMWESYKEFTRVYKLVQLQKNNKIQFKSFNGDFIQNPPNIEEYQLDKKFDKLDIVQEQDFRQFLDGQDQPEPKQKTIQKIFSDLGIQSDSKTEVDWDNIGFIKQKLEELLMDNRYKYYIPIYFWKSQKIKFLHQVTQEKVDNLPNFSIKENDMDQTSRPSNANMDFLNHKYKELPEITKQDIENFVNDKIVPYDIERQLTKFCQKINLKIEGPIKKQFQQLLEKIIICNSNWQRIKFYINKEIKYRNKFTHEILEYPPNFPTLPEELENLYVQLPFITLEDITNFINEGQIDHEKDIELRHFLQKNNVSYDGKHLFQGFSEILEYPRHFLRVKLLKNLVVCYIKPSIQIEENAVQFSSVNGQIQQTKIINNFIANQNQTQENFMPKTDNLSSIQNTGQYFFQNSDGFQEQNFENNNNNIYNNNINNYNSNNNNNISNIEILQHFTQDDLQDYYNYVIDKQQNYKLKYLNQQDFQHLNELFETGLGLISDLEKGLFFNLAKQLIFHKDNYKQKRGLNKRLGILGYLNQQETDIESKFPVRFPSQQEKLGMFVNIEFLQKEDIKQFINNTLTHQINKKEIQKSVKQLGLENTTDIQEFKSIVDLITINPNDQWVRKVNLQTKNIIYTNLETKITMDFAPLFPQPEERKNLYTELPDLKRSDIEQFMIKGSCNSNTAQELQKYCDLLEIQDYNRQIYYKAFLELQHDQTPVEKQLPSQRVKKMTTKKICYIGSSGSFFENNPKFSLLQKIVQNIQIEKKKNEEQQAKIQSDLFEQEQIKKEKSLNQNQDILIIKKLKSPITKGDLEDFLLNKDNLPQDKLIHIQDICQALGLEQLIEQKVFFSIVNRYTETYIDSKNIRIEYTTGNTSKKQYGYLKVQETYQKIFSLKQFLTQAKNQSTYLVNDLDIQQFKQMVILTEKVLPDQKTKSNVFIQLPKIKQNELEAYVSLNSQKKNLYQDLEYQESYLKEFELWYFFENWFSLITQEQKQRFDKIIQEKCLEYNTLEWHKKVFLDEKRIIYISQDGKRQRNWPPNLDKLDTFVNDIRQFVKKQGRSLNIPQLIKKPQDPISQISSPPKSMSSSKESIKIPQQQQPDLFDAQPQKPQEQVIQPIIDKPHIYTSESESVVSDTESVKNDTESVQEKEVIINDLYKLFEVKVLAPQKKILDDLQLVYSKTEYINQKNDPIILLPHLTEVDINLYFIQDEILKEHKNAKKQGKDQNVTQNNNFYQINQYFQKILGIFEFFEQKKYKSVLVQIINKINYHSQSQRILIVKLLQIGYMESVKDKNNQKIKVFKQFPKEAKTLNLKDVECIKCQQICKQDVENFINTNFQEIDPEICEELLYFSDILKIKQKQDIQGKKDLLFDFIKLPSNTQRYTRYSDRYSYYIDDSTDPFTEFTFTKNMPKVAHGQHYTQKQQKLQKEQNKHQQFLIQIQQKNWEEENQIIQNFIKNNNSANKNNDSDEDDVTYKYTEDDKGFQNYLEFILNKNKVYLQNIKFKQNPEISKPKKIPHLNQQDIQQYIDQDPNQDVNDKYQIKHLFLELELKEFYQHQAAANFLQQLLLTKINTDKENVRVVIKDNIGYVINKKMKKLPKHFIQQEQLEQYNYKQQIISNTDFNNFLNNKFQDIYSYKLMFINEQCQKLDLQTQNERNKFKKYLEQLVILPQGWQIKNKFKTNEQLYMHKEKCPKGQKEHPAPLQKEQIQELKTNLQNFRKIQEIQKKKHEEFLEKEKEKEEQIKSLSKSQVQDISFYVAPRQEPEEEVLPPPLDKSQQAQFEIQQKILENQKNLQQNNQQDIKGSSNKNSKNNTNSSNFKQSSTSNNNNNVNYDKQNNTNQSNNKNNDNIQNSNLVSGSNITNSNTKQDFKSQSNTENNTLSSNFYQSSNNNNIKDQKVNNTSSSNFYKQQSNNIENASNGINQNQIDQEKQLKNNTASNNFYEQQSNNNENRINNQNQKDQENDGNNKTQNLQEPKNIENQNTTQQQQNTQENMDKVKENKEEDNNQEQNIQQIKIDEKKLIDKQVQINQEYLNSIVFNSKTIKEEKSIEHLNIKSFDDYFNKEKKQDINNKYHIKLLLQHLKLKDFHIQKVCSNFIKAYFTQVINIKKEQTRYIDKKGIGYQTNVKDKITKDVLPSNFPKDKKLEEFSAEVNKIEKKDLDLFINEPEQLIKNKLMTYLLIKEITDELEIFTKKQKQENKEFIFKFVNLQKGVKRHFSVKLQKFVFKQNKIQIEKPSEFPTSQEIIQFKQKIQEENQKINKDKIFLNDSSDNKPLQLSLYPLGKNDEIKQNNNTQDQFQEQKQKENESSINVPPIINQLQDKQQENDKKIEQDKNNQQLNPILPEKQENNNEKKDNKLENEDQTQKQQQKEQEITEISKQNCEKLEQYFLDYEQKYFEFTKNLKIQTSETVKKLEHITKQDFQDYIKLKTELNQYTKVQINEILTKQFNLTKIEFQISASSFILKQFLKISEDKNIKRILNKDKLKYLVVKDGKQIQSQYLPIKYSEKTWEKDHINLSKVDLETVEKFLDCKKPGPQQLEPYIYLYKFCQQNKLNIDKNDKQTLETLKKLIDLPENWKRCINLQNQDIYLYKLEQKEQKIEQYHPNHPYIPKNNNKTTNNLDDNKQQQGENLQQNSIQKDEKKLQQNSIKKDSQQQQTKQADVTEKDKEKKVEDSKNKETSKQQKESNNNLQKSQEKNKKPDKTDKNAVNTEKNGEKTDKNAGYTEKNGEKTDKNAKNTQKNEEKTDKNGGKPDKDNKNQNKDSKKNEEIINNLKKSGTKNVDTKKNEENSKNLQKSEIKDLKSENKEKNAENLEKTENKKEKSEKNIDKPEKQENQGKSEIKGENQKNTNENKQNQENYSNKHENPFEKQFEEDQKYLESLKIETIEKSKILNLITDQDFINYFDKSKNLKERDACHINFLLSKGLGLNQFYMQQAANKWILQYYQIQNKKEKLERLQIQDQIFYRINTDEQKKNKIKCIPKDNAKLYVIFKKITQEEIDQFIQETYEFTKQKYIGIEKFIYMANICNEYGLTTKQKKIDNKEFLNKIFLCPDQTERAYSSKNQVYKFKKNKEYTDKHSQFPTEEEIKIIKQKNQNKQNFTQQFEEQKQNQENQLKNENNKKIDKIDDKNTNKEDEKNTKTIQEKNTEKVENQKTDLIKDKNTKKIDEKNNQKVNDNKTEKENNKKENQEAEKTKKLEDNQVKKEGKVDDKKGKKVDEKSEKVDKKQTEKTDNNKSEKVDKKQADKTDDKKSEKVDKKQAEKTDDKKSEKVDKKKEEKTDDKKSEKIDEKKKEKVEDKKSEKVDNKKSEKVDKKQAEKVEDKKIAEKVENKKPEKVDGKKEEKKEDKKLEKVNDKKAENLDKIVDDKKVEKIDDKKEEKVEDKKAEKLEDKKGLQQDDKKKEKEEKQQKEKEEKQKKEQEEKQKKQREKLEKMKLLQEKCQKLEKQVQELDKKYQNVKFIPNEDKKSIKLGIITKQLIQDYIQKKDTLDQNKKYLLNYIFTEGFQCKQFHYQKAISNYVSSLFEQVINKKYPKSQFVIESENKIFFFEEEGKQSKAIFPKQIPSKEKLATQSIQLSTLKDTDLELFLQNPLKLIEKDYEKYLYFQSLSKLFKANSIQKQHLCKKLYQKCINLPEKVKRCLNLITYKYTYENNKQYEDQHSNFPTSQEISNIIKTYEKLQDIEQQPQKDKLNQKSLKENKKQESSPEKKETKKEENKKQEKQSEKQEKLPQKKKEEDKKQEKNKTQDKSPEIPEKKTTEDKNIDLSNKNNIEKDNQLKTQNNIKQQKNNEVEDEEDDDSDEEDEDSEDEDSEDDDDEEDDEED